MKSYFFYLLIIAISTNTLYAMKPIQIIEHDASPADIQLILTGSLEEQKRQLAIAQAVFSGGVYLRKPAPEETKKSSSKPKKDKKKFITKK